MIDEKTMVADTLAGINGELTRFGEMIPQTENKQLKQTLKQLRNACETSRRKSISWQEPISIMCRLKRPALRKSSM